MNSLNGNVQTMEMGGCPSAQRAGNLHKLAAVARIKWLCISRNTMIMIGPVLVIGMVYVCKILYGINSGGTLVPFLRGVLLNIHLPRCVQVQARAVHPQREGHSGSAPAALRHPGRDREASA